MTQLKEQITQHPFGATANYNYTDLVSGLGIQIFYGSALSGASGGNGSYGLFANVVYSDTSSSGDGTYNFDTSVFNSPRTVKGTAYVQVPVSQSSAGNTITLTTQLKKVGTDGTTLTNLSSSVQNTRAGNSSMIFFIPHPLTQTIIKKGEKLRLTLVLSVNSGSVTLYHDPSNRSPGSSPDGVTILKILMPFRLDV